MKATLLSVWLFVLTMSAYAGKAEMKLIEAAFRLDSVAVESLLKAGADPNANVPPSAVLVSEAGSR